MSKYLNIHKIRENQMNPKIRISPIPKAVLEAEERVEVRATPYPYEGELFLKVDEPQVGQQH